MEHIEKLLDRPAPQDMPDIPPANDNKSIDCDPPTKKEIYQAINQSKNVMSAGPDSVPAETLLTDIETSVDLLHPLFQKKCKEEQFPLEPHQADKELWPPILFQF